MMAEPKHLNPQYEPLPDLPDYDPEPAEGVRVGESPVPGLTLRRILRGHTDHINRIAWSPDGRFLASPSDDSTIRIWDVARGECTAVHQAHSEVTSVAWSQDGIKVIGSIHGFSCPIILWDLNAGKQLWSINTRDWVNSLAWSPIEQVFAASSYDATVRVYQAENGRELLKFEGHNKWVNSIAWSPDGLFLASGSEYDYTVNIWDIRQGKLIHTLESHSSGVWSVAYAPDGKTVASESSDSTIRIWDPIQGKLRNVVEGHTGQVYYVSFSYNGNLLASKSDNEIRIWQCDTWEPVAVFGESGDSSWPRSLAFHPHIPILATPTYALRARLMLIVSLYTVIRFLSGGILEARKLKTVDDLLQSDDERVELINGEIVKRPMARSEHALIQSSISDEVSLFKRKDGLGGWWIMLEISVKYNEHQCPSHDLAGWRKERVPVRPTGIMNVIPDWVCEITSPGHERKDLFHNFILLQRSKVPYYWVISPEDKTLIAYRLVDEKYHVTFSVECRVEQDLDKARIPPFEEVEIDLKYVFGDE